MLHESYNCYKPRRAILQALEDSDEPLSPYTIAQKTGKKHSTIRVYLRRMVREGEVRRVTRGLYCNISTHGVGLPVFRLHNLCLSALCPWLVEKLGDVVELYGETKLRVQFGVSRHKVSIFLGGESKNKSYEGMSYDTVCFGLSIRAHLFVNGKSVYSFPS